MTPKAAARYVVRMRCKHTGLWSVDWEWAYGEPTPRSAEQFRRKHNRSQLPGGVNDHHTRQLGGVTPHFVSCVVVDRKTRKVVARAKGE